MSPDASVSVSSPSPASSAATTDSQTDICADWPELDILRLRYIHLMIKHAGGNKSHAAKLLGIDRRTLNRTLARERQRERAAAARAQQAASSR